MSEVKIVSISKPIGIAGVESAEDFIAYAARVSNPGNQINAETAPKLLKYLAKHKHWSPFEMVSITMEIKTTRDIGRQILRHRSFSFQEFSQRYAEVVDEFEIREARLQDQKNRQNSISIDQSSDLHAMWQASQNEVAEVCRRAYKNAIDAGIAKEQARSVLPEGMTKSTMYMSGTLRSWLHYIELRKANGTQKEHQDIAISAWSEIIKHFPSLEFILASNEPKPEPKKEYQPMSKDELINIVQDLINKHAAENKVYGPIKDWPNTMPQFPPVDTFYPRPYYVGDPVQPPYNITCDTSKLPQN